MEKKESLESSNLELKEKVSQKDLINIVWKHTKTTKGDTRGEWGPKEKIRFHGKATRNIVQYCQWKQE